MSKPPDNKWKIVRDEDGKEYVEVNAQVMIPQDFDPSQGGLLCANPLTDTSPPMLLGTIGGISVFSDATIRPGNPIFMGRLSAGAVDNGPLPEPPEPGRFENLDFG